MITEIRRFGLDIIRFTFESPQIVRTKIGEKKYDSITVFSYEKLKLPGFQLVRTKTTPVIDIQQKTIEEVAANFNKTTRNEINRTMHMPELTFEVIDGKDDRGEWYALYKEFELAQHRSPIPYTAFSELIIFGARLYREPISAVACVEMSSMVRVHSIFSKRLDVAGDQKKYATIGFASKRAMYEVIQFGIRRGRVGVDLAYASTEKTGISNYKMSFGGTLVPEYRYEKNTTIYSFVMIFGKYWGRIKWLRDYMVSLFLKQQV